jgi:DNA-directed RNA polymerase subunit M/transcription elongation factor TFIIS
MRTLHDPCPSCGSVERLPASIRQDTKEVPDLSKPNAVLKQVRGQREVFCCEKCGHREIVAWGTLT